MDERELVQRARAGDQQCFAQLFHLYVREALRAAYLITRDWTAAEDVVQETFIRAYAALPSFDPARPFRPWLYRIATREALRHAGRHRRLVPMAELPAEALAGPPADEPVARWEERDAVCTAVMHLTETQRTVVVLKYFLGFKEAEIAEMLGIPAARVKSRLFEARRSLERLLHTEAGD